MNRFIAVLAILLLVGGGIWYRSYVRPMTATPTLTITSPRGGEVWRPGETHTLAWGAVGVPSSDKISVTIRRIPPPPLQEEGQEFDPIVFTDLPNVGSTTWTISPMYPDGTYAISVNAYTSTLITDTVSAESAPFTITHPTLAADLYPLYSKVGWEAPKVEQFQIGTTTYAGASAEAAAAADTMNPGAAFTPFEDYYAQKLAALGWSVSNDLAAGGHTGGQTGYYKGGAILLTRYRIDYKTAPADAPSTCPCDVTLSVFSGN